MLQALLVFIGGGIGAAARHWVNIAAARVGGIGFPWGTLTVNILGSFVMGLLAAFFAFKADANWTQNTRLFLTTGILGGFTTFSAFSLDTALLWERGQFGVAAGYVAMSVGASIAALFLGLWLVRSLV
jgi:CrcB protein